MNRGTPQLCLLAPFFLLLNVDVKLEAGIIVFENESMQAKLTHFYIDLRSNTVTEFFCNEGIATHAFVEFAQ